MLIYILFVTLLPLIRSLAAAIKFPSIFERHAITGETYIFVGDDLRLTCSPPEDMLQAYSVRNISFSFSRPLKHPNSPDECLPMSLVHEDEVNQRVSLVVHNVTLDRDGQYTCHIGNKHCLGRQDIGQLETLDADDVVVEYPPHNVSQFTCVFYNWNDFVNCTWQHPVEYTNLSNINISAAYTVSLKNNEVHAYRCPHLSNNDCTFNSSDFFLANYYVIEVNVTNILKSITASKNFIVNANKAVKPAPVINLSANSMPGCITLSWEHSKKYQKIYRIRHQNVGVNNFEIVHANITNTSSSLCGYGSYTHHNFSVDCHPDDIIYSGYWSDPVYIDVWTPMTAPNIGPTTINGSYTTSRCINGLRNVTLMWQNVEESQRNGIIAGYFIKHGEKYLKNVTSDTHLAVVELSCDSPSELTIFAYNKGGYSLTPSVLVVSPINSSVPDSIAESFVVEISDNANSPNKESLRAVWNMTEDTKHLSYIIFWCLGQPGSTCEGPINWSEVSDSQMSYDFPTLDALALKYLFGISVKNIQTGRASSIFWTGCLFRHSLTLHVKKVQSMDVLENGTGYVRVGWTQLQCSYVFEVKVSHYRVKWCEVSRCNDTDGVFHEIVPATSSSYTVSPLTANENYEFTVQAVAGGHAGDEYHPWVKGSPHPSASSNLLWIVFVIVIFPVLGIASYFGWKCDSRRKHIQRGNNSILVLPVDHQQSDSPHRSPSTSDRLMPGAAVSPTIQYQANTTSVLIIPGETTSGEEATSASTAGDSYADDPSANSRTRLIKGTPQKRTQRQCLPDAPEYVGFYTPGGAASALNGAASPLNGAASALNGAASALECSSQESGDTGVYKHLPTKKDSSKVGRSSTSVTTGAGSVDSYVQMREGYAGEKDNPGQAGTSKQIHGQINPQPDQVVLCLNQVARVAEGDYSNFVVGDSNVCDMIMETQSPDDAVINVEPAGSSILGAQSAGVNIGNIGTGRTSSEVASSDMSIEIYMNSSSEQSCPGAERPSCSNGYISHKEV